MEIEISRSVEEMFGRDFAINVALYDLGPSYFMQYADNFDSLTVVYSTDDDCDAE